MPNRPTLDPDMDTAYDFPVKTMVPAAGLPVPTTTAARSVFDLGAGFAMVAAELPPARPEPEQDDHRPWRAAVTIDGGATRCTGSAYPANRWDAERVEVERQRRARQRPPRPVKGAKTRGRKVRVWDGEQTE